MKLNRKFLLFFNFLIFLMSSISQAEDAVKIFETNRPAQELLTIVKPLVSNGGTVSAFQNKLVVKSSAENLIEISKALAELDHPQRNLIIFVNYSETNQGNFNGQGIRTDGVNVSRNYSTEKNSSEQQVRVIEGEQAYISVALEQPQSSVQMSRNGVITTQTRYQTAGTGFYVKPSLNGDRVRLEISTQNDSFKAANPDTINRNHTNTVLTGRLGEWIRFAGAGASDASNQNELHYSTNKNKSGNSTLSLRVEITD